MNIHEYQAKAVLKEFGVPVVTGGGDLLRRRAENAAAELGGPVWVVKAQIHAGGRGKGHFREKEAGDKGGVRIAKSAAEVAANARQMLGLRWSPSRAGRTGGWCAGSTSRKAPT